MRKKAACENTQEDLTCCASSVIFQPDMLAPPMMMMLFSPVAHLKDVSQALRRLEVSMIHGSLLSGPEKRAASKVYKQTATGKIIHAIICNAGACHQVPYLKAAAG